MSLYAHYIIVICEISCTQMNNICYHGTQVSRKKVIHASCIALMLALWNGTNRPFSICIKRDKKKGNCLQVPRLVFWCSWLQVMAEPTWGPPGQSVVARISPHAYDREPNRETKVDLWSEGKGTYLSCILFLTVKQSKSQHQREF